jgi:hypothetical protein
MIANDREFDGVAELSWPLKKRAPEESPVGDATAMPDAQQPE